MKLELFYSDYCPFCQMVLNEIKNLNLSGDIHKLNTQSDQNAAKKLLSTTGRRTVPCLFIEDEPMFESRDIIDWLKTNKDKIKG